MIGSINTKLLSASFVKDGTPVEFEQRGYRIWLKNLPEKSPDEHAGIAVLELVFEESPNVHFVPLCPQFHFGESF